MKKVADMELDMVADKDVDKVADMVAGHGCWSIGPKLFRPEAYPACASSRLWEFIYEGFICTTTQQLWNISILKETSIFLRSLSTGIILPLFVKQFG